MILSPPETTNWNWTFQRTSTAIFPTEDHRSKRRRTHCTYLSCSFEYTTYNDNVNSDINKELHYVNKNVMNIIVVSKVLIDTKKKPLSYLLKTFSCKHVLSYEN